MRTEDELAPYRERLNAATQALRKTLPGRLWLKHRKHWLRHLIPRGVDDEYVIAKREWFFAEFEGVGILATTRPPR